MHKTILLFLLTLLPTAAFSTTNYDPGVNGNIGGYQGTDWADISSSVSFSGLGTTSGTKVRARRVGDSLQVIGYVVSGTHAASALSIDFTGYTFKFSPVTFAASTERVGFATMMRSSALSFDGDSGLLVPFIDGTDTNSVFIAYASTSSVFAKANGNSLGDTGAGFSFDLMIPISGWSAGGAGGGVQYLWSGYHDDDCTFSRTNTAFGDPAADSTCTFTQLQNQNFGTVTSYVSGSDKLPGLVFTPTFSGMIYICAGAKVYKSSSAGDTFIELSDTGSQVLSYGWHANGSVNTGISVQTCGIYSATSGVAATIRLRSKASAGSVVIGDNGGSTTAIDWTMYKIN